MGRDPGRPWQPSRGPRQAHQDGFDLHANVRVGPLDHRGREHLVQYVLRPPLAQQRLERRPDGHVVVRLQRPWRDGTRALVFPPLAVLERLAALTPRPRINLLVYHGVLAPNAAWRAAVVPPADDDDISAAAERAGSPRRRCRHIAWATLLQRVFEIDVLACPRCGGRLRVLATIEEPAVVQKILTHVGLPTAPSTPRAPLCANEGETTRSWSLGKRARRTAWRDGRLDGWG
ncbi:MAG: transposase [Gemmatimonadota bacterium]|nr:MAG: transposase [Gemmatimonadota bacterium]